MNLRKRSTGSQERYQDSSNIWFIEELMSRSRFFVKKCILMTNGHWQMKLIKTSESRGILFGYLTMLI